MKTSKQILCLLFAGLITSIASAEPEEAPRERSEPGERFAKTDTNGDGALSLDEIKATRNGKMAEHFEKLDANGDGLLSKDELEAGRKHMKDKRGDDERKGPEGKEGKEGKRPDGERPDPAKMFKRMDADESGSLSKDEVKGPMKKAFDKIDTNTDGELTPDELKAFHEKRGERESK